MPKKLKSAQQDSATATVETRTEVFGIQDGMPRSAIGTGLVDYELRPEKMPARLLADASHALRAAVPVDAAVAPRIENAIKKVIVILRTRTGHDFGQYKPSTINRRMERRMTVQQIDSIDDYVRLLQQSPTEVTALFKDLLIGVTKFFRDPEAFKVLEDEGLSKLLAGRDEGAPVRVWVPGCSTGEEAYSVAILLAECQESMKRRFKIQVFATDIDRQAVATARTGIYPESIAADLAPERLARCFSAEQDDSPGGPVRYRVHKDVSDMLIFSEHDVIMDPPFSRLDLISCRNLLIYINGDSQRKLIQIFHYALNPGGFLLLGSSETVGSASDLFSPVDRKLKLYRRQDGPDSARRRPEPGSAS